MVIKREHYLTLTVIFQCVMDRGILRNAEVIPSKRQFLKWLTFSYCCVYIQLLPSNADFITFGIWRSAKYP